MSRSTPLRARLARFALGAVTLAAVATIARTPLAWSASPSGTVAAVDHEEWLHSLKGKHRQLFDASAPNGGIPLVHLMNYYDTYNTAYNTPDSDISGVLTFYGFTVFHGLSDEMWAKYKLGEFIGESDADGRPLTANPWRANPTILGNQLPQASIEAMQKRGAKFIICNNALGIFAGMIAQQQGLDAATVLADMKAHILPGVSLVPAMVIAIDKAQQAGVSYHRQ
ncbi:MAG: hypothetical protein U0974_00105 [Gemmatimonadales bacterium]|nr:hypothetical protein [Gemmatimonadales bacterium]MDZ4388121.1 hypothetical protein [Gemmatimonadales bacterium]